MKMKENRREEFFKNQARLPNFVPPPKNLARSPFSVLRSPTYHLSDLECNVEEMRSASQMKGELGPEDPFLSVAWIYLCTS